FILAWMKYWLMAVSSIVSARLSASMIWVLPCILHRWEKGSFVSVLYGNERHPHPLRHASRRRHRRCFPALWPTARPAQGPPDLGEVRSSRDSECGHTR